MGNLVDDLVADLVRHEGYREYPYDDKTGKPVGRGDPLVGKVTIGIGWNISDRGLPKGYTGDPYVDGFDRGYSEELVRKDIQRIDRLLTNQVPAYSGLNDARKKVLVNMAFNLGEGKLFGFTQMLRGIDSGDFNWAADNIVSNFDASGVRTGPTKYKRDVGHRADEMSRIMRRGF